MHPALDTSLSDMGRFCLRCEECECTWYNPEVKPSMDNMGERVEGLPEVVWPTWDEIVAAGWDRYSQEEVESRD